MTTTQRAVDRSGSGAVCVLVLAITVLQCSAIVSAAPLTDAYILYNHVLSPAPPEYPADVAAFINRQTSSVRMAIAGINANPNILPNTTLHLIEKDNINDVTITLKHIVDAYNAYGNALVGTFVGAGNLVSEAAMSLCGTFKVPVSATMEATSAYSNRNKYPTAFRIASDSSKYGEAYGTLFNEYGWYRVAYVYERTQPLLTDMAGTSFMDRTVDVFSVPKNPSIQDIIPVIHEIEALDYRVVFLDIDISACIPLLAYMETAGLRTKFQLVMAPNLAVLGYEELFPLYGLSADLMSGAVAFRMYEDFDDPYYLAWAYQYIGFYLTYPDPRPPYMSATMTDFQVIPPRRYESIHYDSTYLIAQAVHMAHESGVDAADINSTSILPFIYSSTFSGAANQNVA